MSDNIIIENAKAEDFLRIAELDRMAWDDGSFIPDGEHTWRIWCEYSYVLVARDTSQNGTIAGALLVVPGNRDIDVLHKIFVASTHRGQGIGTKLMQTCLDNAQQPLMLTVDPNNPHAIQLYERFGFEKKELVKGYYRAEEDRYVMTWTPDKRN